MSEVIDLTTEIADLFKSFNIETAKPEQKASARRARKISLELEKKLKIYRKISIK